MVWQARCVWPYVDVAEEHWLVVKQYLLSYRLLRLSGVSSMLEQRLCKTQDLAQSVLFNTGVERSTTEVLI